MFGKRKREQEWHSKKQWWLSQYDTSSDSRNTMLCNAYTYIKDMQNPELPEEVRNHAARRFAECKSYFIGLYKFCDELMLTSSLIHYDSFHNEYLCVSASQDIESLEDLQVEFRIIPDDAKVDVSLSLDDISFMRASFLSDDKELAKEYIDVILEYHIREFPTI